jgi:hypothetical protein
MAGLLEYTKNGQVTEPPLYRFMRGNVQSFLNSIPDPSKMTPEEQLALGANINPIMGLLGATAYHGSPAIFDKFNINKVGSGEGAQAYGHGMYFAENPKVAEDYAKKLGIEKTSISQLANDYLKQDVPPSAIRMLHDVATSSTPIEEAARKVQGGSIALRNESPDVLKNIVSDFRSQSAGNVYKVDIPDESMPKMLDWNKPFNKQTTEVQDIVKKIWKENNIYGDPTKLNGEGIYGSIQAQALGNTASRGVNRNAASEAASMDLNYYGIKGIKYLDEMSREAGQGTSNFVVFDPSNVRILERNNKGLLK